jgi:hypothetical protein|tara:strand:- start:829 stop:1020 length:192 start_codon:yes stop_codon:yes gene_type:complete
MAATYTTSINFGVPVLPQAELEYNQTYFDQYNEVLRLYFVQLNESASEGVAQEYSQSVAWFMG